ncbi:MAG: division/cell wall cluster transcriptional repressor MraZ [Candidatus Lindowbacteria bacterium RIFCSPLOWO2_12_FULL_62_27]|nr:MAG: division/cell wall cluster transcriptional repressor MraZ [Candidatus Lindowbacteria bacterium RIFCSPLOWO2_12_FULL_62_27]OGH63606.1 MAG: division/cell wall cluster transcriptional repressor MraZ [Candidatus Lindowbacteria bacterium RIFCSPLOWO2_02_FULL_62_12]
MYIGSYTREVDGKGRFLVPAKLKVRLDEVSGGARKAGELVLTRGFERCVYLFPKSQWSEFLKREIESRSELSKDIRKLKRMLTGKAEEVEVDRQGRLLIPKAFLEEHLQMKRGSRRIVVVGVMDHIEIWREEAWQAASREMQDEMEEIAEKISRAGAAAV